METLEPKTTDNFTPMMIFASTEDFPVFALEHDIHFRSALGLYEGIVEEVYVVRADAGPVIYDHGILDRQKSVLLLSAQEPFAHGLRDAFLAQPEARNMTPIYIGKWTHVPARVALLGKAWTCYPEEGLFYVAKKVPIELQPSDLCDGGACDILSQ